MKMAELNNLRIIPSTTVSASSDSGDIANTNAIGGHFVVKTSNSTGSPSVTVTIQGKDTQTGAYYTILQSAAITTDTETVLKVFPGFSTAANSVANDILTNTWRITYSFSGTGSIDLEVGANLVG